MYKFIQVHGGTNSFRFSVKTTLNLVFFVKDTADVDLEVRLVRPGARAVITGIVFGSGETKISIHTMQIHEAPETLSDLLVKSVLSDRAKCLYDGGIRVEKRAQKTDAYQRNENLLLTGRAYAESKPSLEILANDVRCTHGAATGPVDGEQLWYLATRGMPQPQGETLITEGFIRSALMRLPDARIINKLWQTLFP